MNIRPIKKQSLLLNKIHEECTQLQVLQPDFDRDFFDEPTMKSYLNFLVLKNHWAIINDTNEIGGENEQ